MFELQICTGAKPTDLVALFFVSLKYCYLNILLLETTESLFRPAKA